MFGECYNYSSWRKLLLVVFTLTKKLWKDFANRQKEASQFMIPNFSWSTCLNSGVLWFSGKPYWLFESINVVKSEEHQYLQVLTRGRKGRHWWEEHQIQRRRKAAACKTSLDAATASRPPTATPGESCTGDTWTLSYIAVTYGYSVFTINTLWSLLKHIEWLTFKDERRRKWW